MRVLSQFTVPFLGVTALAACASAQQAVATSQNGDATTAAAITSADLRARVGIFAHDSMMGRAAGTPWNDKGTDYIARELTRLGLEPAGENGTFFQSVMARRGLAADATVTVDGRTFVAWRDFLPRDPHDFGGDQRDLSAGAQAVYGGAWGDTPELIGASEAAGKVVIIRVPAGPNGEPRWQANRQALTQRYRGAAAIVVASLDAMPQPVREQLSDGSPTLRTTLSASGSAQQLPAFWYGTRAMSEAMLGAPLAGARAGTAGRTVRGALEWRQEPAPGRNVIAVLRGRDPAVRGQYVAIGAHNDHVGFLTGTSYDHDSLRASNLVLRPEGAEGSARRPSGVDLQRIRTILDSLRRLRPEARRDSIFNGADDDASGSMAMLELAEALARAPVRPRRSVLFVWHTGEELGLFGAQYFTDHPTVPRDSIVAQVNIDMIGRGSGQDTPGGGPGYVQLIGSRRLSTQLGDLVEVVNRRRSRPFTFDYQYDASGHPQQFYCRSDHYMYARYGIPVVFMSTGGHVDYHMVTDEPQYLDYDKYREVTQFIHDVAAEIADRPARLVVDKPKPDPQGQCVQ